MKRVFVPLIIIAIFSPALFAQTCDYNATTSTFSSVLSSATGGQTICLAAGSYGTISPVQKSSPGVTITPAPGVSQSSVTMSLSFRTPSPVAQWLIFNNVYLNGGVISGPANNITVQNSTITSPVAFFPTAKNNACSTCAAMNNNNILFNNDIFDTSIGDPIDASNYADLSFVLGGPTPAGIKITNSTFQNGCDDGVNFDTGGMGVTIGPGNEFKNMVQGSCANHIDPIQFIGSNSPGPTITGNYFHNNSTGIAGYDYSNSATITNNVIASTSQDWLDAVGFDSNSIVAHNTLIGGTIECGYTHEGNACQAQLLNNITVGFNKGGTLLNGSYGNSPSYFDYNLCTGGTCALGSVSVGSHSLSCTPTYVGGTNPTTYAGFALTATSCGHAAANDGSDIGVNVTGSTGGSGAPAAPTNLAASVQ